MGVIKYGIYCVVSLAIMAAVGLSGFPNMAAWLGIVAVLGSFPVLILFFRDDSK